MIFTVVHDQEGDWVALYKHGVLVAQGHSFQEEELLKLVGLEPEVIWDADARETGSFPQRLEDVVRA